SAKPGCAADSCRSLRDPSPSALGRTSVYCPRAFGSAPFRAPRQEAEGERGLWQPLPPGKAGLRGRLAPRQDTEGERGLWQPLPPGKAPGLLVRSGEPVRGLSWLLSAALRRYSLAVGEAGDLESLRRLRVEQGRDLDHDRMPALAFERYRQRERILYP